MPVILIAEAPAKVSVKGGRALDRSTASGRRMAALAGVEDVSVTFTTLNLVDRWPGRTSHGGAFPAKLAKANADLLWRDLPLAADLLLIGRASTAFGVQVDLLRWEQVTREGITRRCAIFPPPNGRFWSEPKDEMRARRFMRALVRDQ